MGKNLLCTLFNHKFGKWEYAAPDSCEKVLACSRCGYEKEKRLVRHNFDAGWKYVAPDSCEKVLTCSRCGYQKGKRLANHNFEGEWIASDSCMEVLTCKRCRIVTTRETHQYGKWEHKAKHTMVQICQKCGDEFKGKPVAQHCVKCGGDSAVEVLFITPGDILCDYCRVNDRNPTCPLCHGTGWIKYPSVLAIECIECGAVLHSKKVEINLGNTSLATHSDDY
jgi:hypothetical protein